MPTLLSLKHRADSSGVGTWVARNSSGNVIEARVFSTEGSLRPVEAEANSVKEALSWLKSTCRGNAVV